MEQDAARRLTFLGRQLPRSFELRLVIVAAGAELAYEPDPWSGALVVLEQGAVELECRAGGRRRFADGAVLCFQGLALRLIRNVEARPAVLLAVRRRPQRVTNS